MAFLSQFSKSTFPFDFRNKIINGDMRIDQRRNGGIIRIQDTRANVEGFLEAYALDRWLIQGGVPQLICGRSTDAPPGFNYSLRIGCSTINPNPFGFSRLIQRIEGPFTEDLLYGTNQAKTATLSFWVKGTLAGTYTGSVEIERNTDSLLYNTYFTYTINTANTWEYKNVTIPGNTSVRNKTQEGVTGIWLNFVLTATQSRRTNTVSTGTWQPVNAGYDTILVPGFAEFQSNYHVLEITGVQLENRAVATPFEHRPISLENLLCLRYYSQPFYHIAQASQQGNVRMVIPFPMEMANIPLATTEQYSSNEVSELQKNYISVLAWTAGGNNQTPIHNWVYKLDAEI